MKKVLLLFISALLLSACSKEDNGPQENVNDRKLAEIASVLNGRFTNTTNDISGTKTKELIFLPYSSPKEMEFSIPSEYVSLERKVKVYGECKDIEYYNDHLLQVNKEWRYIIHIAYESAQPELWLYPIGVYGRYETHKLTIKSKSSFTLDDIIYNKDE